MNLDRVDHWLRSVLAHADASPPWRTLSNLLGGGQRIRPRLVLALAGPATDVVYRDAAALELVHLSTLVHDDIIDHGSARRGVPTLNEAHGIAVALLVGNIVRDHALGIATAAAVPVLNEASLDVNRGQLAETMARGHQLGIAELLPIQHQKTARAFRHAGRLASLHAREPVPEDALVALELAALAFQAVDDWLDLLPPGELTGKSAARDAHNAVPSFVHVDPGHSPPAAVHDRTSPPAEAVVVATAVAQRVLHGAPGPLARLPLRASRTLVEAYTLALSHACAERVQGTCAAPLLDRLTHQVRERLLRFNVDSLATPD